ncbi:hypothetical protein KSF78_0008928 [Schistosoma japonicum]|nr:hypothetical protein KSF78_0008928 [Schistosoma japonicum]KAH8858533.1 hypothetical protein KSF78_0008928 [Schistosoma japonicum]
MKCMARWMDGWMRLAIVL